MNQFVLPQQFALNANGDPIVGAQALFYRTGTLQTLTVYADPEFSTPHDPEQIRTNGNGYFPAVFIEDETYKCEILDSDGVTIHGPFDNLSGNIDLNSIVSSQQLYNTPIREIQADYTATVADIQSNSVINAKPISQDITVELPSAAEVGNGYGFTVRKGISSEFDCHLIPRAGSGELLDGASNITLTTFNEEFRPVSDGANWIISKYVVPDGDINVQKLDSGLRGLFQFVGQAVWWLGQADSAPDGLLLADGSLHNIADYPALYEKYGTMYGGDGVTTFGVPDVRGRYFRGVAGDSLNDPDKDARAARPDGVGGNVVGSTQGDEIKSHVHTGTSSTDGSHSHTVASIPSSGALVDSGSDFAWGRSSNTTRTTSEDGDHTHALNIDASGGAETRGKNIYALCYIVASPELLAGGSGTPTRIHSTTGVPSDTLGIIGDFALDTGSYIMYGPKGINGWNISNSLIGPAGGPLEINAQGDFVDRSNYDDERQGFGFYANDQDLFYQKLSGASGDWTTSIPLGISDGAVTNTKFADMPTNTVKANLNALGSPQDVTLSALVNAFNLNGSNVTVTKDSADLTLQACVASLNADKAPLDNPALTGTATLDGVNIATETYADNAVAALVNSSPDTLDTLNEIAAALGDDPNFATTITASIATKMPVAGGVFTGTITLNGDAVNPLEATTKQQLDAALLAQSTANSIAVTPAGNIAANNVQNALEELDTEKASTSHTHTASQVTDLGALATKTTISDVDIDLRSIGLNKLSDASAVHGDLAYFDGTNWSRLSAGTSGQFLKTEGAGVTPTWDTIPGGGDMLSSNNLSDVGDIATARSNLGLEIGVDIAAAGATGQLSSDVLMMALRIADLEGDALGIVDGVADPFDDETDVDAANSVSQVYTAGKYSNIAAISEISRTLGTIIGNMTSGGGIDEAFDGDTTQEHTQTSNRAGGDGYVGKTYPSPQKISSATIFSTNNFGFAASGSGNIEITLYGKVGTAPANATDGTLLGTTGTFSDTDTLITKTITSNDLATAFDHVWVRITDSNAKEIRIAEVKFYDSGVANDMTLVSKAFTADSQPSNARVLFFVKPIDAILLNADVVGAVSRDSGVTYTNAQLTEVITYSNGVTVFEAESVDISAQPPGTSMKWKLTTANNKGIECSGVVLQWS